LLFVVIIIEKDKSELIFKNLLTTKSPPNIIFSQLPGNILRQNGLCPRNTLKNFKICLGLFDLRINHLPWREEMGKKFKKSGIRNNEARLFYFLGQRLYWLT